VPSQGLGLDPRLAQMGHAERAEPLGELALGPGEQRFVGKARRRGTQRFKHLHLGCGVGNVVLAAQHVADPHRDIVDHRGQQVEPRSIGAAHYRVAHLGRIEVLGAADTVLPLDRRRAVEQEPPVRLLSCRSPGGMIGLAQRQRRAVIDRRQPAPEQHLALEFEFLRALIAAIDPPSGDQPGELRLVNPEPRRLPFLAVPMQPQPFEVRLDARNMLLAAAFGIGIVDPQQKPPARLLGQQPVVQRRADIADMQRAGGRGSETGGDGHAAPIAGFALYCENSSTECPPPLSSTPFEGVRRTVRAASSAAARRSSTGS
jgi:hypothetical protein